MHMDMAPVPTLVGFILYHPPPSNTSTTIQCFVYTSVVGYISFFISPSPSYIPILTFYCFRRTVKDFVNDKDVVLTDKEVDMIKRIQEGGFASGQSDPYEVRK